MLSGPLPASMSRLSALERLSLDGSGLCVPDSPAMRAWVDAVPDFLGVFCEGSVSFSRVVTLPGLGRLDDGANVSSHFIVNNGDGTFTSEPDRTPVMVKHNYPPGWWQHIGNHLADLDNDGDLELVLGALSPNVNIPGSSTNVELNITYVMLSPGGSTVGLRRGARRSLHITDHSTLVD